MRHNEYINTITEFTSPLCTANLLTIKYINKMKLQFDTTAKTVKIEETVNLGEFIEKIEMLLPNGQWKEYKLEVSIINNWTSPIIIERPIPFTNPYRPFWEQPIITCLSHTYEPNKYNVEF